MTTRSITKDGQHCGEVILLDENAKDSERRCKIGVAEPNTGGSITLSLYRLNGSALQIVAKGTYQSGAMRRERSGRVKLATRLLEHAQPRYGCIVVAGPSYGSVGSFVTSLMDLDLPFVVQVKSSTQVCVLGSDCRGVNAGELLKRQQWRRLTSLLPDGNKVNYAATRLADVELPSGCGKLFAARIGGVEGFPRGTVIGLSSFDAPLNELVRLVSYVRWIKSAVRKRTRIARGVVEGAEPVGKAANLRVRANITLARKDDDRAREGGMPYDFVPKGVLRVAAPILNIVDLFAGAGGMGIGFLQGGGAGRCRLVYSGEVNPIYVQTLRRNYATLTAMLGHPAGAITPEAIEPADLRRPEILEEVVELGRKCGGVNVLIAGPPCQGFSAANRNSWHGENPNNQFVDVFLRFVEALRPHVFLMENVQGILWTPKGRTSVSVVDVLEQRMSELGYILFPKLLDAVWYGVPQHRTRFFLMGLHADLGYEAESFGDWGPFLLPSHRQRDSSYVTVAEAISDLPAIGNGAA